MRCKDIDFSRVNRIFSRVFLFTYFFFELDKSIFFVRSKENGAIGGFFKENGRSATSPEDDRALQEGVQGEFI
jgi:hypothetical protein